MTTLVIIRHGNTFEDGDPPRLIGRRTDLPLTAAGRAQGEALGLWLKKNGYAPAAVFCSTLCRTQETARIIIEKAGLALTSRIDPLFDEIDYGPDENQPENTVIERIWQAALSAWKDRALPPPDWVIDPAALVRGWRDFAARMEKENPGGTVLVVTSNGVARFAPFLAGERQAARVATGAYGILTGEGGGRWTVTAWNEKPF